MNSRKLISAISIWTKYTSRTANWFHDYAAWNFLCATNIAVGRQKKEVLRADITVSRVGVFFFLSGSQNYLKNWVEKYFEHMIFNVKNS